MKDENRENKVTEPVAPEEQISQLPEESPELLEELEDTTEFNLEAILEEYSGQQGEPPAEESPEEPGACGACGGGSGIRRRRDTGAR